MDQSKRYQQLQLIWMDLISIHFVEMLKFFNLQRGVNENVDDETLNTILFSNYAFYERIWQLPTWIIFIIFKWQTNTHTHRNTQFPLFTHRLSHSHDSNCIWMSKWKKRQKEKRFKLTTNTDDVITYAFVYLHLNEMWGWEC